VLPLSVSFAIACLAAFCFAIAPFDPLPVPLQTPSTAEGEISVSLQTQNQPLTRTVDTGVTSSSA